MAGSFHSYSHILQVGKQQVMIDLDSCDGVNEYDIVRSLKVMENYQDIIRWINKDDSQKPNYVNVPAGLKIFQLNEFLCPKDTPLHDIRFKRSLHNMGGGAVQSIAGAMSTGTHGSGGTYSAYHDTVRSIVIVDSLGAVKRVEPSAGFVLNHYEETIDGIPVERVTDDATFYALLVNMGCMGIIHSMIMEVQPMKLLHEDAYSKGLDWKSQKSKMKENVGRNEYFYLQLNPYIDPELGVHTLLEKKVNTTTHPPEGKKEARRNKFPEVFTNCDMTVKFARFIMNVRKFKNLIIKMITSSLRSRDDHALSSGKGYTDLTYEVWNAGSGKLKDIGTGIECAFPLDNVEAVVDELLALIQELYDSKKYFLNAPMAIRFVRSSNVLLAPNYRYYVENGQQKSTDYWAYIEVLRINSTRNKVDDMERELFAELQKFFLNKNGRMHWGLNFDLTFTKEQLGKMYPEFITWKQVYHKFNASRLFSNAFTADLDR